MAVSHVDLLIWATHTAGIIGVIAAIFRAKAFRRFPRFTLLMSFLLLQEIVLAVTVRIGYPSYFWSYWGMSAFGYVLHIPVIVELGAAALEPRWILPRATGHFFMAVLVVAGIVGWGATSGVPIANHMVLWFQRVQWIAAFLQCSLFLALFCFRRALAISVGPLPLGIASGFAIMATSTLAVQTILMQPGFTYLPIALQARASVWLLPCAWWIVVLSRRRSSPYPAVRFADAERSLVDTRIGLESE